MAMKKEQAGVLFIVAALIVVALVVLATLPPPHKVYFSYSFETGMEEWAPNGLDLNHDPPLNWSISRNDSMARDGNYSLQLYLENWNDKGKIWAESRFEMKADQEYRVTIEFALGTRDFGSVNHWTMIAGAMTSRPQSVDDLNPAYRDKTGNGQDSDVGYLWLDKSYISETRAGADGTVWVVIGVWGTFETPRTYFIDAVKLTFTER